MRRILLPLLAAQLVWTTGASGAVVSESAALSVDFDTRLGAVRTVERASDILPMAVNSAADWRAGGDGSLSVTVRVIPMGGDAQADPSTWQTGGVTSTVATASGETTTNWTPTVRHLYRLELLADGEVCETAHFDVTAASDLAAKTSISGCTLQLEYATAECTGYLLTPTPTVTDGLTELVVGRDYVVVYANNFYPGTAVVSAYGIGAYADVASANFVIQTASGAVCDSSALSAPIDTRVLGVRKLLTIADLQNIAWNSASDWRTGGDGTATATVSAMPAMAVDPADPSTWTSVGVPTVVASATGEGTVAWEPVKRGYYQLTLSVSGGSSSTNYFDLSETAELDSGTAISGYTVVLSDESFPCRGYAIEPAVVVSNGTETLIRDQDYAIVYGNNFYAGEATVTVLGIGAYEGSIEKTFAILPVQPEAVAAGAVEPVALDTRQDAVREYRSKRDMPLLAFNNLETFEDGCLWPCGGLASDTVLARISAASLAEVGAEPGAWEVLAESDGEGTVRFRGFRQGLYRLKLEVVTDGTSSSSSLTADVFVKAPAGTAILVR